MSSNRFFPARAGVVAVAVVASLSLTATGTSAGPPSEHPLHADSSQVVLDWERIAFGTIYPATPIPVGVPILGFTSGAMYDAARASLMRGRSSETAAVASAAHDVLEHYVPAAGPALDAQLQATLATIADPRSEAKGLRIGGSAAARMLASRVGDGWNDESIRYSKAPAPGVWQPVEPNVDMLAAWLGSLDPLVLDGPIPLDGPDPLTSAAYAADYEEVRVLGRSSSPARTPEQTDTALFFNSNSATMVGDAMIRLLEEDSVSLRRTARFFARMHAAMTDSVIQCWRLKRDVGFWRPFQAIAGAASDGNPATAPEAGWTSLIPSPNYSEYVSGHACLTAPAAQTVRSMFGEDTALELRWAGSTSPPTSLVRTYDDLSDLESDALNARIWSGLHFRDAMDDGYLLGHATADRVAQLLP